jgi:tRNA(adenine34) deaminase
MPTHENFMLLALNEARNAFEKAEVPVGAVIVRENKILARAHNLTESLHDCSSHAEMLAIREASRRLQNWRLEDCTLYVTLEPCPMCAGLIRLSRIPRIIFAAFDERAGAFGSKFSLHKENLWGPEPEILSGVLQEESRELIREFFRERRK